MAGDARDGYAELSSKDRERVDAFAVQFAAVKQAAEFFGRRPRRFSVVPEKELRQQQPPLAGAKLLHLVRHGEGFHNVYRSQEFAAGRTPYAKRGNMHEVSPELHDPLLTEKGQAEAAMALAQLRSSPRRASPQLLVTSPMRRAVQTLLVVFEDSVASGVTVLAHELCRETFQGVDPSIYDSRRDRDALAKEFPCVNFKDYVLPAEPPCGKDAAAIGDPMWWHCGSAFGGCEGGVHEAAMVEHAWGFLRWLMARPEQEIGVATHSLFLVALFHGALDPPGGGRWPRPQLFHTGELRSIWVAGGPAPRAEGAILAGWGHLLVGGGLCQGEGEEDDDLVEHQPPVQRRGSM
eukprot:CAMPEP_0179024724 /NCGR_PEP_ID=MMETSP0796-20121207/7600_1 /TAXON_ID=73915 /ORGANISM="Pyrodinium bahamense, Strain pbaha01" /LENGTH=348 /DNA_ID=CAMNT_0020720689 /DNA_START=55 /DNA_END=1101 /DNA_ORIENTATION=-